MVPQEQTFKRLQKPMSACAQVVIAGADDTKDDSTGSAGKEAAGECVHQQAGDREKITSAQRRASTSEMTIEVGECRSAYTGIKQKEARNSYARAEGGRRQLCLSWRGEGQLCQS